MRYESREWYCVQEMKQLDPDIDSIKRRGQATAEARAEILRLAQSQGDTLATSFADLLGDGGPSDEPADEMIQAIREWRDKPSNGSGAAWLETGEALTYRTEER
jgi:hypothetical protein